MQTKVDYIVKELWVLAWNASVQRANLYRSKKTGDTSFRNQVIDHLTLHLIPQYGRDEVSEKDHYSNIAGLIAYASRVGDQVLASSG